MRFNKVCDICENDGWYVDDSGREVTCIPCCEHAELDHGVCIDCDSDTEMLWAERAYGIRE